MFPSIRILEANFFLLGLSSAAIGLLGSESEGRAHPIFYGVFSLAVGAAMLSFGEINVLSGWSALALAQGVRGVVELSWSRGAPHPRRLMALLGWLDLVGAALAIIVPILGIMLLLLAPFCAVGVGFIAAADLLDTTAQDN
jgi:hypothetical protein